MNIESIQAILKKEPALLLYFWTETCQVCHALKPKLFKALDQRFPKIRYIDLNATQIPQITAHFHIFSVPTAILFFEGKEAFRIGRNVSLATFLSQIERPYGLLFGSDSQHA